MIPITVPGGEFWNPVGECFENTESKTLNFEHSLYSISKWEEKWHVPFLSTKEKTTEQMIDYIKCMCLEEVDDLTIRGLTRENMDELSKYIEDPRTATTFSDKNTGHSREIITNEIVYFWMLDCGIPFECQFWHINKLLTLIRVCQIKRNPSKKMGKNDIMRSNAELNALRRARLGSKG